MKEFFCRQCPALLDDRTAIPACTLHNPWRGVPNPDVGYCYAGRQIMQEQESFRTAQESFGKQGDQNV